MAKPTRRSTGDPSRPNPGDETHAAFGRRSIPAEPRRCAPLIVALRSEYTRYSFLTRLVSRAPRRPRRSPGFHHRLLTASLRAAHRCVSVEIHPGQFSRWGLLPHAPCQPGASLASSPGGGLGAHVGFTTGCYERASTVLTSNKGFEEWGTILGDEVMAAALLDRLLHHCHLVNIRGNSYRLRRRGDLARALHQAPARKNPAPRSGEDEEVTPEAPSAFGAELRSLRSLRSRRSLPPRQTRSRVVSEPLGKARPESQKCQILKSHFCPLSGPIDSRPAGPSATQSDPATASQIRPEYTTSQHRDNTGAVRRAPGEPAAFPQRRGPPSPHPSRPRRTPQGSLNDGPAPFHSTSGNTSASISSSIRSAMRCAGPRSCPMVQSAA